MRRSPTSVVTWAIVSMTRAGAGRPWRRAHVAPALSVPGGAMRETVTSSLPEHECFATHGPLPGARSKSGRPGVIVLPEGTKESDIRDERAGATSEATIRQRGDR